MSFMSSIISALNSCSDYCYQIYVKVIGWVWPFWEAAGLFYQLSVLFATLAWQFYDFSNWVSDVQSKVLAILNWSTIWSYILSYVPNLTQVRDWFYSWWSNVTSVITSWWSATQYTVQVWISTAVQPFNSMLTAWNNFWNSTWPAWVSSFNSLKSAWDNFWRYTLPNLASFDALEDWWNGRVGDLQGLINSAFTVRASLWQGWQDMRDNVVEFFTDPVEYIWERFTDWFLGPEG
jgi:hypothetical protein